MSLPERPTNFAVARDPLLYLYGVAPASLDASFQHVIAILDRWLNGSDDPVPEPDPPPPPCPKPPDPDPPPVPAYPLGELLVELQGMDTSAHSEMWEDVTDAFADWLVNGPFQS